MAGSTGKQNKFEMVIGAVDRFSNVFKGFNDRVDRTTAKMREMQGAVGNLNKATGLARLSGAVSGLGGRMSNVVNEGKSLVATVTGLAGKFSLVFGAAGGGLFALAKSTANAGDAAAKAAARAGVGVKIWQEYAHAANLSDVSSEELGKSFIKLQESAIKASQGDKTQASLLKLAGIDPKTAKGEIKNADSLFLDLSDKVKALQDAGQGAKAVNLVKNILGEEGTRLMPMLLGGAAGLKDMRQEAHKLGLVLSAEDASASEGFNDGLTKLLGSLKGIGYSIGRVLLPPLTVLMAKFTDWSAAQRDIMSGGFAGWVASWDVERIWNSIESGMSTLGNLGRTVQDIATAFGGWENVALALGAVLGGKFLLAIGGMITAFGNLGLVIMTTPVGWFLGACALIGAAAYAIYKNWDGFCAYFQNLWQGVRDAFSRNWLEGIVTLLRDFNPFRLVLKGMNEMIAYFTGINLMEYGAQMVDSFGAGLSERWQSVMDWFMGKLKWFSDKWAQVKGFLGFGDDPAAIMSGDGAGRSGQGSGMGAPLGMGAAAQAVNSRSEHVEKNEVIIKVQAENGATAQVTGSSGAGTSMQTGQLMYAGG